MYGTASNDQQSVGLVRAVVVFVLSKLVNDHTRRMVFVTTIHKRTSRLDHLKQSAMVKLNQLMAVATDARSLPMAARLHNLVWGNTDLNTVLSPEVLSRAMSEDERREISTRVVDMAPKCLRYGKPDMIKDVQRLLSLGDAMPMPLAA